MRCSLIPIAVFFSLCACRSGDDVDLKHEDSETLVDISRQNILISDDSFDEWIDAQNDQYFPIKLIDTTFNSVLIASHYLKKFQGTLFLVESENKGKVMNYFPLLNLDDMECLAGANLTWSHWLFPSPQLARRLLSIFCKNLGERMFEFAFDIRDAVDSPIEANQTELVYRLVIQLNLNTGTVLCYSQGRSDQLQKIWF